MKKFRIFVDFEKEEVYLNEMAKKGYVLEKYSCLGFYTFREGTPQDLHYRIDYRTFKNQADFNDYRALFDDAGWHHVYGARWDYNQYFLPKDGSETADIFSTKESAAARYKHLESMCLKSLSLFVMYAVLFMNMNHSSLDEAFLTPGLWDMTGAKFVAAFLFELPFAFFRVAPFAIFLVLCVVEAIWAVKAKKLYKEKIKEASIGVQEENYEKSNK